MIEFPYDSLKAIQATALLLKLSDGGVMKYLGLLKLLYMADRIALTELEEPITGDLYYSMKFGPVLSHVYNMIKGEADQKDENLWEQYISTRDENYDVFLLKEPGVSELCEAEEEILRGVFAEYGHQDRFDLAKYTHEFFPEWEAPDPQGAKSTPIEVEAILKEVGKSKEEIESIRQEAEQERKLDLLLSV